MDSRTGVVRDCSDVWFRASTGRQFCGECRKPCNNAGGPTKLARGRIFSIFGTNIGGATGIQAGTFPLPTELGGASAQVTVNGVTKDAIIPFSNSTQINAILPSDLPSALER